MPSPPLDRTEAKEVNDTMPVQLLHEIVAAPPLDPCRRRQLEPVPPTSSLIGDVLVAFDQITSRAWRASGDRFFACFLIAAPTSRRRRNPAWSARRRVEDAGRQRRAPPLMGYLFIPPTFVFLPHPARFPSQVNEGSLPTVKKMPCGCGSNCSCGSGCGCE